SQIAFIPGNLFTTLPPVNSCWVRLPPAAVRSQIFRWGRKRLVPDRFSSKINRPVQPMPCKARFIVHTLPLAADGTKERQVY
ncbi:MAG: hypothetical protein J4N27_01840, partial [Chloroflexi bacterium]|nr:hypothetical protein [Chloroflexota bacterium]